MEFITPLRPDAAASLALALIESSQAPLLVLDDRFVVISASASFCSAFGIVPRAIEGIALAKIGNGEWDVPQLNALLRATLANNAAVESYEMNLVRDGHATACVSINAQRLDLGGGQQPMIAMTVTDITSARLAAKLKDELVQEKQILLRELQHRVANSLQIIASVLMQSARRVQSEETRTHLYSAHNRVMSIATLQKQLAITSNDEVELRPYLKQLCDSIGASMIDDAERISLSSTADDTKATANVSVSLGLIVTELVINALKHAFPEPEQSGSVTVDYAAKGEGWSLTVKDDGVGIGNGDGAGTPGLGTGIVDALAKQLGATVTTSENEPGTKVSVEHP
ncbi:sensor histidine kinase [Sphingomonas alba]|uniref:histidine kinase n=1 Tax=Sphingomonas alba TaxID=2908208 RepID=A0ABT0RJZ3_9SPHN|nr:histidine kinase dimerization/phosphoacceptor domain -containing protein [Sphingomonas alba]MCL6682956.1 ATP-binding protein [Sphingomonas alba]